MIIQRRFRASSLLLRGLPSAVLTALWAVSVYVAYREFELTFVRIPFLPIASVGTAVAFYVGFKNNSSYERFWEGRKIWGGIVNASRTWATSVLCYIDPSDDGSNVQQTRQLLVYRHLAWVNALRLQLRMKSRFFDKPAKTTKRRLERHSDHMRNDWDQEIAGFLTQDEHQSYKERKNPATHMLNRQGADLRELVESKQLDLYHQVAMMNVIAELYALQGKCERIKNTPFPRQYAEYSRLFTRVFVFLLPFGLLDVFGDHAGGAAPSLDAWTSVIPMALSTAVVSWVFLTMEGIGDATEDPFERSLSDVPMNALSRTIEIDLREMLGEQEIPEPEKPIGAVLY